MTFTLNPKRDKTRQDKEEKKTILAQNMWYQARACVIQEPNN